MGCLPVSILLVILLSLHDNAVVNSKSQPEIANDLLFELKSSFKLDLANDAVSESKRGEDVSAIRHLSNEERIVPHTDREIDGILAMHDEFRSDTNPEASNMEYMHWNEDLAYLAGLWASVCYWGHGMPDNDIVKAYKNDIGQNLWMGGGKPSGVNAVVSWHNNEVNNFDYDDNKCKPGRVCGHYTQVVWANSKEVGCSRAFCKDLIDNHGVMTDRHNQWIEACHYAPSGNYVGQKPYKSGPSCTQCKSGIGQCYNNMCRLCSDHDEQCDCRQICHHCGTLTSDCSCSCRDGWYGDDCSSKCKDYHKNCWKSPGWPGPQYCPAHPAIPRGCPLMCGVCVEDEKVCDISLIGKPTSQSSTGWGGVSARAVDGRTNGDWWDGLTCTHTANKNPGGWWMVDQQARQCIRKVILYNRVDSGRGRLKQVVVRIGDDPNGINNPVCGKVADDQVKKGQRIEVACKTDLVGQYISIHQPRTNYLALCEVQVICCTICNSE